MDTCEIVLKFRNPFLQTQVVKIVAIINGHPVTVSGDRRSV